MRPVVLIPALDAAETVGTVVRELRDELGDALPIFVIDDGSRDATAQVAEAAGARVLQHLKNLGKGAAIRTGLRAAREAGFDVAVTVDADGIATVALNDRVAGLGPDQRLKLAAQFAWTLRQVGVLKLKITSAGQPYETAFALQTIWLTNSIRRDHERALDHVDRALDVVRDRPELVDMYFDLLDNRLFSLQNLDRLDEAQRTLRGAPDQSV